MYEYTSYAQTSYKEDGTPKSPPPLPLPLSPCDVGTVQKQKKIVKENEAGTRVTTSLLHTKFKTQASKQQTLGMAL